MIGGRRRFGKAGGTVKVVDPYVGPNVLISDVRSPEGVPEFCVNPVTAGRRR